MTDEFRTGLVALLPRLRRFAYALSRDVEQGDDIVQESCLRALSRAEQWQPGTRFDSWMFRIAKNIWLDKLRARKVRGETVDIDAMGGLAGSDGRQVVDSRLTLQAVNAGIAKLPAEEQVLVALVCIDGLSYKEAADIEEIPLGTVMSRLARARRNLHAHLEQPVAQDRRHPSAPTSGTRT